MKPLQVEKEGGEGREAGVRRGRRQRRSRFRRGQQAHVRSRENYGREIRTRDARDVSYRIR